MIQFAGHGILLDIEGTTSSVSYVYDVLVPIARRELDSYLRANWNSPDLVQACELIARDVGFASLSAWCGDESEEGRRNLVRAEVVRLMDADVKATGLKQLQGLIWLAGYESGELQSHVYDDVPPALAAWRAAGRDVRIYSSGSIAAQKLFFGHTIHGDLLPHVRRHYDTTTGPKREAASYTAIAGEFGLAAAEILFLSDLPAELDAAHVAGFQTALCERPGNAPVAADHGHAVITDFREIELA